MRLSNNNNNNTLKIRPTGFLIFYFIEDEWPFGGPTVCNSSLQGILLAKQK